MNNNDFDYTLNRFENITKKVIINDFFGSEEYLNKKRIANQIFIITRNKSDMFLDVVKGNKSGQLIGLPNNSAMCFKNRFLKKGLLQSEINNQLERSIDDTYYFGFLQHQFLWNFPTREKVNSVNIENLFVEYYPKTLIADNIMKGYIKDGNLTNAIFQYYFESFMEKFLKNELHIGFFKRGQCKSFLRNLYLAGALLGMEFDLQTT